MKRKKALLKKYGSRKAMYKILREENHLQLFVDEYGQEIMLNPVKHFLKKEPYVNKAYNKRLVEVGQKYAAYVKSLQGKDPDINEGVNQ